MRASVSAISWYDAGGSACSHASVFVASSAASGDASMRSCAPAGERASYSRAQHSEMIAARNFWSMLVESM